MKLFKDLSDDTEYIEIPPLKVKFVSLEDYLFNRIIYIRDVLANYDKYVDAPDKITLYAELYGLLNKYQNIISDNVNLEEIEDELI